MTRPHRRGGLTTGAASTGAPTAGAPTARGPRLRALIAGTLLAGALLPACSPDAGTPEETTAPPANEQADDPTEAADESEGAEEARVRLTATPHPVEGIDLVVEIDHFRWAPENADDEPVPGEGHANLYVDGEHHGRLYASRLHLPLEPGTHEIRVTLNDSHDDPVLADGEPVEDTTSVTVPEREDHDHEHGHGDDGHAGEDG
jgi:hypothetical protein